MRRVVTGHDEAGRSIVLIDEDAVLAPAMRPGVSSALLWWAGAVPADNDLADDMAKLAVATTVEGGAVFRVVRYDPGVAPRRHRTSSVDFAVVLSGEIELELDEGSVTLRAGDFLVQRGTIHNWMNRGASPVLVAFVLLAARPYGKGPGVLLDEG